MAVLIQTPLCQAFTRRLVISKVECYDADEHNHLGIRWGRFIASISDVSALAGYPLFQ
jgi:hypothetical protein